MVLREGGGGCGREQFHPPASWFRVGALDIDGDGIHGAVVRRRRVVSAGPVDICDFRELAPAVLDVIDTYQSIFKN